MNADVIDVCDVDDDDENNCDTCVTMMTLILMRSWRVCIAGACASIIASWVPTQSQRKVPVSSSCCLHVTKCCVCVRTESVECPSELVLSLGVMVVRQGAAASAAAASEDFGAQAD